MEVRNISEKTITGFITRTNNASEMTPDKGKIPGLWQKFDARIPVDYKNGERVFGVYFNYESDHNGEFDVLAGFDGTSYPSESELKQITIPKGKYLVFNEKGDMPQIAINAWTRVWEYFNKESDAHQRLFLTDFEFYPSGNEIEVHIGIK